MSITYDEMPLTAADKQARYRARKGAGGRRRDKVRKRHERDSASVTGANSPRVQKLTPKHLFMQAAEVLVAAGELDDHRADALVMALETLPRVKTERQAGAWLKTTAENLDKAETRRRSELVHDSEASMREFDLVTGDVDTPDLDRPRLARAPAGIISDSTGPATFFIVQRDIKMELWVRIGGLKGELVRDDGLSLRKVPELPKS